MSWDDEDFSVPTSTSKVSASWEDELEDEPVLESWDIDSDEEREKEKAKKAEIAAEKKKKEEEAAKKKAAKDAKAKKLLELDAADPLLRKELLKKAELESDLNNAADLFAGLGVADEHPRARAARLGADEVVAQPVLSKDTPIDAHPLFQAETKQDFVDLRKALAPAIINLAEVSLLNYSSSLVIDLVRDICGPLSVENFRKLNSTLAVLMKEKERQERQLRLSKAGTAVGGAGKKKAKPAAKSSLGSSSFKKDLEFDTTNYDDDDFADDDFM